MGDTTVIDLIRHGEPEGGVRIRGSRDDPLSDIGWSQMWSAVGQAKPWHEIVSSPLSRCAAFARELGSPLELSVHEEHRF